MTYATQNTDEEENPRHLKWWTEVVQRSGGLPLHWCESRCHDLLEWTRQGAKCRTKPCTREGRGRDRILLPSLPLTHYGFRSFWEQSQSPWPDLRALRGLSPAASPHLLPLSSSQTMTCSDSGAPSLFLLLCEGPSPLSSSLGSFLLVTFPCHLLSRVCPDHFI